MGFFVILLFVALTLLSDLLKPSPKNDGQRPASLGDFSFPTATEKRVVPIVWGTVKLSGPNVVWYGDLRPRAITESVKTGLFSSEDIVTGYRYFIGIQMGLCRGELDSILRIFVDDEVLWDDGISADGTITIDKPRFFGGANGQGGITGDLSVRLGTESQSVVTYLEDFQAQGGDTPAYRGTAHVVLEGMYMGTSTSVKPWQFEVRRIPNGLELATPAINDGNDANPANVIYEILTNTEWGLGLSGSTIDTDRFELAAATLLDEGNGFSFVLDSPREAYELLQEIQRQIDGVVFLNRTTGLWDINLARGGYNIDAVTQLTVANVKDVREFSRGSWAETQNILHVGFASRAREYQETYAAAQDMANIRTQVGQIVKSEINYPGVKDSDLAVQIAWRDLRSASFPLARVTLECDRTASLLNPGDVVAWTDPDLDFTKFPLRIIKIDMGELTNGRVIVEAVQDVFTAVTPSFNSPGVGGWSSPVNTVVDVPLADRQVFEAPAAFVDRDPDLPGVVDRVWVGLLNQGDGAITADISLVSSEVKVGSISSFLLAGQLGATLSPAAAVTGTLTIDTTPSSSTEILEAIDAATTDQVGDGLVNLARINDEFIGFTGAIAGGPGEVVLQGIMRGMLDSVPPSGGHADTDRVWILSAGGSMTTSAFSGSINLRPLPVSNTDSLDYDDATSSPITMASRAIRPYPPVDPKSGASALYGLSLSMDVSSSVSGSGENSRGNTVTFTRRDFRLGNEYSKIVDESSLPDDFPAANTTEYQIEVIDDPTGSPSSLYTTEWSSSASVGISRLEILAANAGVLPSSVQISINARHTYDGDVLESRVTLDANCTLTSSLLSGLDNLGVVTSGVASASYVAPTTGTYSLDIGDALPGGTVDVNINSGGWTNVITGSNTTGTFSATATDVLEFRHNAPSTPGALRFLDIDAPSSSDDAYCILDL